MAVVHKWFVNAGSFVSIVVRSVNKEQNNKENVNNELTNMLLAFLPAVCSIRLPLMNVDAEVILM